MRRKKDLIIPGGYDIYLRDSVTLVCYCCVDYIKRKKLNG